MGTNEQEREREREWKACQDRNAKLSPKILTELPRGNYDPIRARSLQRFKIVRAQHISHVLSIIGITVESSIFNYCVSENRITISLTK